MEKVIKNIAATKIIYPVVPRLTGLSSKKLVKSTSTDLKVDNTIHPITDDQIVEINPLNAIDIKTIKSAVIKYPTYQPSSWSPSMRFSDGYLQPSGMTKEERYPKIYDSAVKMKPKAKRVLSFGCSTGEEVFALAKRFPNALQIVGVDIDYHRVQTARKNNKQKNVFFHDTVGALGQFDVVTALNVFFCLDKPIPKENWIKTLQEVAGYVAPNGILMIFKSEHDPNEVLSNLDFKADNTWIHTHNRNNKNYFCGYYRKKLKRWWR